MHMRVRSHGVSQIAPPRPTHSRVLPLDSRLAVELDSFFLVHWSHAREYILYTRLTQWDILLREEVVLSPTPYSTRWDVRYYFTSK